MAGFAVLRGLIPELLFAMADFEVLQVEHPRPQPRFALWLVLYVMIPLGIATKTISAAMAIAVFTCCFLTSGFDHFLKAL